MERFNCNLKHLALLPFFFKAWVDVASPVKENLASRNIVKWVIVNCYKLGPLPVPVGFV